MNACQEDPSGMTQSDHELAEYYQSKRVSGSYEDRTGNNDNDKLCGSQLPVIIIKVRHRRSLCDSRESERVGAPPPPHGSAGYNA